MPAGPAYKLGAAGAEKRPAGRTPRLPVRVVGLGDEARSGRRAVMEIAGSVPVRSVQRQAFPDAERPEMSLVCFACLETLSWIPPSVIRR